MTLPRIFNLDKYMLFNELEKLVMTFSYLQQRSIATAQQKTLTFDTGMNSYSYIGPQNKLLRIALGKNIKFGFIDGVKGPPSQPTQPITKAITFPHSKEKEAATFNPEGKISPGTVYLIDANKRIMGALTCPISGVSYIRKYKYVNGKWQTL